MGWYGSLYDYTIQIELATYFCISTSLSFATMTDELLVYTKLHTAAAIAATIYRQTTAVIAKHHVFFPH